MKIAVITGVSRGLGESIAKLFLQTKIQVIGISRSENEHLFTYAEKSGTNFFHYTCDLSNREAIQETFQKIFTERLSKEKPSTVYLINNAGVVGPITQAMHMNHEELAYHVQVNTIAPMMWMNSFLQKATEHGFELIGVNITSGAGSRPVYGWSAYCSTKASINIYTETVALEQDERQTGHKVIAFSPGIMDTDMQGEIRESTYDEFIEIDTFKNYKKQNKLRHPDEVAKVLYHILLDEDHLENGKIYRLYDYV
ncbi:MAG TPA: (S)-benzoin forming benzil reductase [Bacillota bacterium]